MGISPMTIATKSTTPTAPPLPTTTTTIQGLQKSHETSVTTHDSEITKMATEETTQEITPTESYVPKRKNDSICLLHRIMRFNFLLSADLLFHNIYIFYQVRHPFL